MIRTRFKKTVLAATFLLVTNSLKVQAQSISSNELREILALYVDGQYDIVKVKLNNIGFKVIESTPDYTLNGTTHAGVFTMIREKESEDDIFKGTSIKDKDRFFFSTSNEKVFWKENTDLRQIEVRFDFTGRGAEDLYKQVSYSKHESIDSTYTNCSSGRKCEQYILHWTTKGHNPLHDIGTQQIENFDVLNQEVQASPHEFLSATYTRKFFYGKIPAAKSKSTHTGTVKRKLH